MPPADVREHAWRTIQVRRQKDREKLDALFSDLIALRHRVAQNAGYENFRDYSFASLGRFDALAGLAAFLVGEQPAPAPGSPAAAAPAAPTRALCFDTTKLDFFDEKVLIKDEDIERAAASAVGEA